MAGLLDIFGTSGQDTMGLLGMSPEDIKRSRDDAQAQALYALAGRLFQGGRGGASIVEGLQQGQQAYRTAMQGGLQQQLQNAQIQEMNRKRQQEQQALMRQQAVQTEIEKAYRPETFADTPLTNLIGQEIAGPNMPQAAGLGLEALAPRLMATPEGRRSLTELLAAQEAMSGKTTTLAEGANLIRVNPITNKVETVAQGAPKREPVPSSIAEYNLAKSQGFEGTFQDYELAKQNAPKVAKLTGKEGNAALMFFGTDDVSKLRNIPNAIDKIRVEASTQRKAEQPQLNINDPTAVQTQQLKTLNQWEGALKDSGAAETAMRAQGFYAAYEQALKGNANADGALIYNVAKVYDPAGAVQAGDVSTVIGVPSMPETIKKAAQKLTTGGSLTPKERENMKKIIDAVVDERSRMIAPSLNTYRKINRGLGGTDDLIVNPYDMVKKPRNLEEILGIGRPRGGQ
jgi:hypothetical protein